MALRVWEACIPLLTTLLASVLCTGLVLTLNSRHTFFSSSWLQVWFAFLELLRGNWVLFSLFIIGPFWLPFVVFIWEGNIHKSPSRQAVGPCQLYLCLQSCHCRHFLTLDDLFSVAMCETWKRVNSFLLDALLPVIIPWSCWDHTQLIRCDSKDLHLLSLLAGPGTTSCVEGMDLIGISVHSLCCDPLCWSCDLICFSHLGHELLFLCPR